MFSINQCRLLCKKLRNFFLGQNVMIMKTLRWMKDEDREPRASVFVEVVFRQCAHH